MVPLDIQWEALDSERKSQSLLLMLTSEEVKDMLATGEEGLQIQKTMKSSQRWPLYFNCTTFQRPHFDQHCTPHTSRGIHTIPQKELCDFNNQEEFSMESNRNSFLFFKTQNYIAKLNLSLLKLHKWNFPQPPKSISVFLPLNQDRISSISSLKPCKIFPFLLMDWNVAPMCPGASLHSLF